MCQTYKFWLVHVLQIKNPDTGNGKNERTENSQERTGSDECNLYDVNHLHSRACVDIQRIANEPQATDTHMWMWSLTFIVLYEGWHKNRKNIIWHHYKT